MGNGFISSHNQPVKVAWLCSMSSMPLHTFSSAELPPRAWQHSISCSARLRSVKVSMVEAGCAFSTQGQHGTTHGLDLIGLLGFEIVNKNTVADIAESIVSKTWPMEPACFGCLWFHCVGCRPASTQSAASISSRSKHANTEGGKWTDGSVGSWMNWQIHYYAEMFRYTCWHFDSLIAT